MNEPVSLGGASVQEIPLELLRRTRLNAVDGERVHAGLPRHRDLRRAALLDRPGAADNAKPGLLLTAGPNELRDLPDTFWNADTLSMLAPTRRAADRLTGIAQDTDWGGEVVVYKDQEEIDPALGTGREEYGMLSIR
jgi:hypothetical protein